MTILNEDRHWPVLTRCIGREDLLADARFATKPDRLANAADLIAILDEAFGARDRPEWVGILRDNGIVFDINWKGWQLTRDKIKNAVGGLRPARLAAARKKVAKKTARPKARKKR